MNVNILKKLHDNSFRVEEKVKELNKSNTNYHLSYEDTLTVINEIINKKGDNTKLVAKQNDHFELVIKPLYTTEIKLKIKWRDRMIDLAEHISKWSKDDSKVGSVLVSKKGGDITLGYNGFPFGVKDDISRYDDGPLKLDIVVHAEVNAVIAAGSRAVDGELYVFGKPICARCAGPIIQSGIQRVFALKPMEEGEYEPSTKPGKVDWERMGRLGVTMFKEAGVECIFYKKNSNGGYEYSDLTENIF